MNYHNPNKINVFWRSHLQQVVRAALGEDIGERDITTEAIIPKHKLVKAILVAKEKGVVCGINIAGLVFKLRDKSVKFRPLVKDGEKIRKGKVLAEVLGGAQSILSAERVALNFLSLLSGVATKTRMFVHKVKPHKVKIMDTRKTLPGLRELEKYAVRIGGAYNHRMRLDEMLLIKDNHLKVAKGCQRLPEVARGYKIEIEVKNLKEFREALKLKPDVIMLDNMNIDAMKKAVKIRNSSQPLNPHPSPKIEASGGTTLKNIKRVASCGIDMISVGALTHSVDSLDISLEIL